MIKHIYERIGETVYEETLENGLHVFVFPKPEFGKCYAFFATRYGGMDTPFSAGWPVAWTPPRAWPTIWSTRCSTPLTEGNALQEPGRHRRLPQCLHQHRHHRVPL